MHLFKHKTFLLLFSLFIGLPATAHNDEPAFDLNALPTLGNSDQQYLTKAQAKEIGDGFYNSAMVSSILIDDIEINQYLRSLITQLHNSSQFSSDPIRILIINNADINAFALPGNIIVIHSGLFLTVQKESELVGVLAHELSHLKQQHLLRQFANQQKNQPKLLLSILAAILIAKDAQTTNAIITAGIASSVQSTLDYTRRQEYEADRIAINVLVKANFDPVGISDFFEILAQQNGLSSDLVTGSEFLRTHPLSQNRIAEAKNRIQSVENKNLIKDSARFQRLKIKLSSLLKVNIYNKDYACYQALLNAQKLIKNGLSSPKASAFCTTKQRQNTPYIQHEYLNLQSYLHTKNTEAAFITLLQTYPENITFQNSLLKHYYRHQQYQLYINHAEALLKNTAPLFPNFYQTLSHIYYKNKQHNLAKYYLSTYYINIGKHSLAKRILDKLHLEPSIDGILRHKTQTLLSNIKIKPIEEH